MSDVVNSYFNIKESDTGEDVYKKGSQLMLGQIEKIHYIDDPSNKSRKFVEYDVSCQEAYAGQSTFRNVRCLETLGGTNDFSETVLENNDAALFGKLSTSNFFKNKNGTTVIIAFINASTDKPVILGAAPHPRNDGAKRSDGIRKLGEFRGIQWEINKDGELTLTYQSNKTADGRTTRPTTAPTIVKIDRNGDFKLSNNESQSITVSRNDKKITVTDTNNTLVIDKPAKTVTLTNGVTITVDGTGDKTTITTASGKTFEMDGPADKTTITTVGGDTFVMDGAAGTITATNSQGKIFKLDGFQILGAGTEPVVLGDTLFNMLQTFLTSLENDILPGGPGKNAASLIKIRDAAITLNGVLADFKSSNSKTD